MCAHSQAPIVHTSVVRDAAALPRSRSYGGASRADASSRALCSPARCAQLGMVACKCLQGVWLRVGHEQGVDRRAAGTTLAVRQIENPAS
jgi:hypothetical protein